MNRVDRIYTPNHDESSRQAFVGALKGYVNGPLEKRLADLYENEIEPKYREKTGNQPTNREEATRLIEDQEIFQVWGSMVYTSQDLMWDTVGETIDRQRSEFEDIAAQIKAGGDTKGSLSLNPDLQLPEPIGSVEIHRQPGGYFYEADSEDLTSALQYFASIELYRKAKGMSAGAETGEPGMCHFMLSSLRKKFPDFKPRRILDLGCAVGTETMGLKEAYPDAEIHGVELSGPFLRFAHLWAESKDVDIHYRQADARDTGYPDEHFDLVFSHILFHETWTDILPGIMREANRILAPGGIFFNGDVPFQPNKIPMIKQITNRWQEDYNGEPFWNKFADIDVASEMKQSGFDGQKTFTYYEPIGAGNYFMFGAHKLDDELSEKA